MCGSHLIRPPAAWTSALARDAAALQPYRLTLSDLQEFGTSPHDIATQMNETLAERQLFSASRKTTRASDRFLTPRRSRRSSHWS
jgi:hypothetical protein